jgi:alkylation response protein AidB-like acyl-CoA dehydrogenase
MNYDLTAEQKLLKDSAREFFSKEINSEFVREMIKDKKGYTEELWRKMADLGWMGLLIPEPYGDFGMSFIDMAHLLYEMGYACFSGPFFSTAVLGVTTLLEAGNDEQKRAILPEVANGNRLLTLAWTEESATYSPKGISLSAKRRNGDYVLSGTKLFVPDAHVADNILCVARTNEESANEEKGVSIFVVDRKSPGITTHLLDSFTDEKLFEVNFDNVMVTKRNLLGKLNQGWVVLNKVLHKAAVAKCAEMSGGSKKVLELAVDHAKKRVQFGRPIGSFQAVQHHCANILTYVDTSTFMTYQACWRISEGLEFEKEASMCKAWVSDSYRKLVALTHQVMGGLGFMEEIDLNLYFNRAKAAELAFGDGDFHRELVARHMGL